LVIDFLQKKIVDKWLHKFVILSALLFNERFLFDILTRFYLDFVIWVGQKQTPFEFKSVGTVLLLLLIMWIVAFLYLPLLLYLYTFF